jgi:hypothetical protein
MPVMAATRWLLASTAQPASADGCSGEALSVTMQGRLGDIVYARLLFAKLQHVRAAPLHAPPA